MTNQMKKILMICLVLSYTNFIGLSVVFIASGFSFSYVFSYVFWAISAVLCAYFQYLKIKVIKEDKEFAEQIFYAKKLLELRELAKLRFYKSRGLEPRYNEDGTVMDPDTFIGILTKLDEDGKLQKSIYEILGIEPVFDKDGKEVPVIVVLKHLMKKPRTSKIEDIKGLSKKMVLKGTQKASTKDDKSKEKKKEQAKAPQAAPKIKKEAPGVYAVYVRKKDDGKGGKSKGGAKAPSNVKKPAVETSAPTGTNTTSTSPVRGPVAVERPTKEAPSVPVSISHEQEQDVAIME